MSVIKATCFFDGDVFRPETPVDVEPNARYVITIVRPDAMTPPPGPPETAWDVLHRLKGTLEGPGDWASEHDHYLYGTPKRSLGVTSGKGPDRP